MTQKSNENRSSATAGPADSLLHGMGLDIGLPLVAYYGLHAFGADTWVALLAATIVSGARSVWIVVRQRRFNPFSALMLAVFGVGLLLAFVTGDPKLIILKDSVFTGIVGIAFLLSLVIGRPLTLEARRSWSPKEAAEIDEAWRTNAAARHGYRVTSLVWGREHARRGLAARDPGLPVAGERHGRAVYRDVGHHRGVAGLLDQGVRQAWRQARPAGRGGPDHRPGYAAGGLSWAPAFQAAVRG